MSTQTLNREQVARKHAPNYKVILHNDDHNTMDHVVEALVRTVPQLSAKKAIAVMLEAHQSGSAVVLSAPQEHAEMYQDGLQAFGLTVTVEPDV